MNRDKKRLNILLIFSSIVIVLFICFITIGTFFIIKHSQAQNATPDILESLRNEYHNLGFSAILIYTILSGILLGSGISILKIKWDNEWIQKQHARYGIIIIILSFLMIAIIFLIIFYFKAMKIIKQNINNKKKELSDENKPTNVQENLEQNNKLNNLKQINEEKINSIN